MSDHNQTDSEVTRERIPRAIAAFGIPFCVLLFGYWLGGILGDFFEISVGFGQTIGLILSVMCAIWIFSRSFVTNNAIMAFVTVNPLSTLIGEENPLVTYGPGSHFCYPWEQRDGANTVNLGEAAESFSIKVQGPTGDFTIKYSARLRPDIKKLPEFLAGVASVATDLSDLISAEILAEMSGKEVEDALKSIPTLNVGLKGKFQQGPLHGQGVTGFEGRFGVIIGDVTAGEILPSKDVSETMASLTESATIDKIVAKSFGYDSAKEIREAVKAGDISDAEVNRRRHQTMAMSGNLQGMDLKEQTFNLRVEGLDNVDPALINAIATMAPAFAAMKKATTGTSTKSTTKPRTKP